MEKEFEDECRQNQPFLEIASFLRIDDNKCKIYFYNYILIYAKCHNSRLKINFVQKKISNLMKFFKVTFKMAAISANINFRVGSEAKNFANDLNYLVSKFHAFTTF